MYERQKILNAIYDETHLAKAKILAHLGSDDQTVVHLGGGGEPMNRGGAALVLLLLLVLTLFVLLRHLLDVSSFFGCLHYLEGAES